VFLIKKNQSDNVILFLYFEFKLHWKLSIISKKTLRKKFVFLCVDYILEHFETKEKTNFSLKLVVFSAPKKSSQDNIIAFLYFEVRIYQKPIKILEKRSPKKAVFLCIENIL